MQLDHVLIAVTDLTAAASELDDRCGLASIAGGRHAGLGTANRIVPLGETYIELVAVVDAAEAATNVFGQWVARSATAAGRPLGWAVRSDDLDEVARRLDLAPAGGARMRPQGDTLRWRMAGLEAAAAEPSLPFFIEWCVSDDMLPGRQPVSHRAAPHGISRLELGGDPERLIAWLGGHAMPIVVSRGRAGVTRIVIASAEGEIVLGR